MSYRLRKGKIKSQRTSKSKRVPGTNQAIEQEPLLQEAGTSLPQNSMVLWSVQ